MRERLEYEKEKSLEERWDEDGGGMRGRDKSSEKTKKKGKF